MSLFIEVRVGSKDNSKIVAFCHAFNTSNLEKISNYEFTSKEAGAKHLGIPPNTVSGAVEQHNREQSVWALVEKIAKQSR